MNHIIFCGTPAFAVKPLEALLAMKELKVSAVVTQPDKKKGRHQSETMETPVKKSALAAGVTVLQPERFADCKKELEKLRPMIGVVVAYGQKIPESLLTLPTYGWVNIHASLLPKYRGASPIQSAILAGDQETGVSLMHIEKGMDTGAVYAQKKIPITGKDTTETVSEKLSAIGAELLKDNIVKISNGTLTPQPQDSKKATRCVKMTKEEGALDFRESTATELSQKIRALTPWPGCYTFWNGHRLKILAAKIAETETQKTNPGTAIPYQGTAAIVCKKGLLIPLTLQKEGKKAMQMEDFLRGNQNFIGAVLTAS